MNKNDNFNMETKTLLVFTFLRKPLKCSVDFQHISNMDKLLSILFFLQSL